MVQITVLDDVAPRGAGTRIPSPGRAFAPAVNVRIVRNLNKEHIGADGEPPVPVREIKFR
jgi:hypothetical protein